MTDTGTGLRDEVLRAYRDHVSIGMAQLSRMMRATVETRSEGPYVWDEAGERYLDCGGYGVFTLSAPRLLPW